MKSICLIPQVSGVGGMVSFRAKFAAGLQARGIQITSLLQPAPCDSILVIAGTRNLPALWRAKRRGLRIVQRLDGMNWLHRRLRTGLKHYLRAEYGNLILRLIRAHLADAIVYQSEFSRQWWERRCGPIPAPSSVVYNAVDLEIYCPQRQTTSHGLQADYQLPADCYRLLLVEGSLMGGYELGLETAIRLVDMLNHEHRAALENNPVELVVAGRVSEQIKTQWQQRAQAPLVWAGLLPPEQIPALDRSAHLLDAADLNAACPNAVIEALACGLPVLAFDTGALPELVTGDAGRVAPYGGDPWQLDPPDIPALAAAALQILSDQPRFRAAARARAEAAFDLDTMIAGYLHALLG